jgi:hypothetical protein
MDDPLHVSSPVLQVMFFLSDHLANCMYNEHFLGEVFKLFGDGTAVLLR